MAIGQKHHGNIFITQKEAREITQMEGEVCQHIHSYPNHLLNGGQQLFRLI